MLLHFSVELSVSELRGSPGPSAAPTQSPTGLMLGRQDNLSSVCCCPSIPRLRKPSQALPPQPGLRAGQEEAQFPPLYHRDTEATDSHPRELPVTHPEPVLSDPGLGASIKILISTEAL